MVPHRHDRGLNTTYGLVTIGHNLAVLKNTSQQNQRLNPKFGRDQILFHILTLCILVTLVTIGHFWQI
jgi:hypothetical protein